MLISMSVLDTTIKRYIQGNDSKKSDMLDVLKLSVANNFDSMIANSRDILSEIDEDESHLSIKINELAYRSNKIDLKKKIYERLDMYRKYYLD